MDILKLFSFFLREKKSLEDKKFISFCQTLKAKDDLIQKKVSEKERKSIPKINRIIISYKSSKKYLNFNKKFLFFLIIVGFVIVPISSYYEIKIKLITPKGSRIMDGQAGTPDSFCKNTDCYTYISNNYFESRNNIIYLKGNVYESDYFNLKWNDNDMPNLKGIFRNCSNITSIEFINFNDYSDIKDISKLFLNCTSLKTINFGSTSPKFINVKDMSYTFTNCSSLEELDISSFDFSLVSNMNSMFKGCYKLATLKLPKQKTSSLTNMGSMFQSCSSFMSLDLSNFDTSSVTLMNDLFHDCSSLTTLNIKSFKTEKVIKMESMFENCKGLTTIDLKHFYTPSLRQFHNIFSGCTSVKSIDISQFDTFQITNFASLFYNCQSLTTINSLAKLVTNMATNMSYMFYNCSTMANIDLSKFNTQGVTEMKSMFKGCSSLVSINLESFDNPKVEDISEMFSGCTKLNSFIMTKFETENVKYMQALFKECISFESLDLTFINTSNVIDMSSLFYGCISLKQVKIINFDTSKVINMDSMFYNCYNLLELNITNFDTTNVENIDSMFYNCNSLKSLDIINFDTRNIKSMKSVFYHCTSLENIDLSNFNTEKVLYMDALFYECNSFIILDLEKFTLTNVKSMTFMFKGCISLTSIILPDFTKLSVTNTSYMFDLCSSLTSMDLTNFDSSHIIDMDYMFSNCIQLKYLNLNNWNTEKVKTMNYLFSGCSSLIHINLSFFNTPNLESIRGMFYACISLESIDLSNFNTSFVKNMDYLFYKDFSLREINFTKNSQFLEGNNYTQSQIQYFTTEKVQNMRGMFAYCHQLKELDLSIFNTSNVIDTSNMFSNCLNLTSINLSNFNIEKVISMEKMFYKCINLSYINLFNAIEKNINNLNQILDETPINMVFCLEENDTPKITQIIKETKGDCYSIICDNDYSKLRKKRILDSKGNLIKCVNLCKNYNKNLEYHFDCFYFCPNGTYEELNEKDPSLDYMCIPLELKPEPCTLQRVILEECLMEDLETTYHNINSEKYELILEIKRQLPFFNKIMPIVYEKGIFSKTLFNETYQISILSNKNMYENLTYIDIGDCENLLKSYHKINANDDLILFKVEYLIEEFRIPIVEYTIFSKDGRIELNLGICQDLNFIYYIPVDINQTDEFKYNPISDYNSKLCFQYTTESNTDIILYERRKEFNNYNLSLCESDCIYIQYENNKVKCECPVKTEFNKFLTKNDDEKNDLIFRFQNNHLEKYNFGVLKCFKMVFNKKNILKNLATMIYLGIMAFNIISMLVFCIRGYKIIYIQVKLLSDEFYSIIPKRPNKSVKIAKNKKNIITTGNNPPKIKDNKTADKKGILKINQFKKKIGETALVKSKAIPPSALMNSKNDLNLGQSTLNLNTNLQKENELSGYVLLKTDMEINMLSYSEAQKKDKRGCFSIYFSFIKTRHILVCIFFRDYNSIVFKICFFFFIYGICLGLNTIFFDDKIIQKIFEAKGEYNKITHIINMIIYIIISGIGASIIKSVVSLLSFTDIAALEIKEIKNQYISKEDKINQALIHVTSRTTRFYIINFTLMSLFWIYAGSFCAVFQNTQIYLVINAAASLAVVIILPFLYYFIPALLRASALSGKDSVCLYKFSQFFELI